ncbi:MAG: glycosyltransferase [Candidatus Eisenbacteria bacterium]
MSRRVLVLAYFFPPLAGGGVHRVLSFTRHLPAAGWSCTVVCAGADDYWVRDPSLLDRVPDGTEVLRVPGGTPLAAWMRARRSSDDAARARRPAGTFAAARRLADLVLLPDPYRGWARRAARVARARVAAGGVDVLLTSSPPDSTHLAGLELSRDTGLPWVADFRDPWIGLHFLRPPTPWHAARQRAMERAVVTGADLVLAASRTHLDDLRALSPRRLELLPNGYEPAPDGAIPGRGSRFTMTFTGTSFHMRQTSVFLDAMALWLAAEPDARPRVRVVLAGPYESGQRAHAGALGLDDVVEFPGPLPHRETRALQSGADLLLLWKPEGPGYRTMVPGKLYEYLDTGRPVLAALPAGDEAADMVVAAGGERVDPGDSDALASALARRHALWTRGAPAPASRPGWLAGHTREALATRLAALLDTLERGHRRP